MIRHADKLRTVLVIWNLKVKKEGQNQGQGMMSSRATNKELMPCAEMRHGGFFESLVGLGNVAGPATDILNMLKVSSEMYNMNTGETQYNEVLGTMKFCLLYQYFKTIQNKTNYFIGTWENSLLYQVFCYQISLYRVSTVSYLRMGKCILNIAF